VFCNVGIVLNWGAMLAQVSIFVAAVLCGIPACCISIIDVYQTTDDEISPPLHNRINLLNTNTLLDENLMMAGIGRNM